MSRITGNTTLSLTALVGVLPRLALDGDLITLDGVTIGEVTFGVAPMTYSDLFICAPKDPMMADWRLHGEVLGTYSEIYLEAADPAHNVGGDAYTETACWSASDVLEVVASVLAPTPFPFR